VTQASETVDVGHVHTTCNHINDNRCSFVTEIANKNVINAKTMIANGYMPVAA
jgi:hypothetical protein